MCRIRPSTEEHSRSVDCPRADAHPPARLELELKLTHMTQKPKALERPTAIPANQSAVKHKRGMIRLVNRIKKQLTQTAADSEWKAKTRGGRKPGWIYTKPRWLMNPMTFWIKIERLCLALRTVPYPPFNRRTLQICGVPPVRSPSARPASELGLPI